MTHDQIQSLYNGSSFSWLTHSWTIKCVCVCPDCFIDLLPLYITLSWRISIFYCSLLSFEQLGKIYNHRYVCVCFLCIVCRRLNKHKSVFWLWGSLQLCVESRLSPSLYNYIYTTCCPQCPFEIRPCQTSVFTHTKFIYQDHKLQHFCVLI